MNNLTRDTELGTAIKKVKLEKPGPDFTKLVMNQVHEIAAAKTTTAKMNILDTRFWIFVTLFLALGVFLIVLSGNSGSSLSGSVLPSLEDSAVSHGYQSLIGRLSQLPSSIAAILIASSALIFIERMVSRKRIA